MKFSVNETVYQKDPAVNQGRMVRGVVWLVEARATSVQGPAGPTSAYNIYRVTGDAWWAKDFWGEDELLTKDEACSLVRDFWEAVIAEAQEQLANIPCN